MYQEPRWLFHPSKWGNDVEVVKHLDAFLEEAVQQKLRAQGQEG